MQNERGETNSDKTFWREPNVQTIKFDQNRFGFAYDMMRICLLDQGDLFWGSSKHIQSLGKVSARMR